MKFLCSINCYGNAEMVNIFLDKVLDFITMIIKTIC